MDVGNSDPRCFSKRKLQAMIEKRKNISGITFFHQMPGEKRGQATCFEELPETKQDEVMDQLGPKGVRNLAKQLAIALVNYHELIGTITSKHTERYAR